MKDSQPKESWPDKGRVEFNNYSTRYRRGLDLVVRSIKVDIKAGENVSTCLLLC